MGQPHRPDRSLPNLLEHIADPHLLRGQRAEVGRGRIDQSRPDLHLRRSSGDEHEHDQRNLARDVIARGLSVRETESLVRKLTEPPAPPKAKKTDVHTRAAEERLRLALGTRVRIVRKGQAGRIEVDFTSEAELQRLYEQLTGDR